MVLGRFIVFEGGDGCGKSSHASELGKFLSNRGIKNIIIKFPERQTPIGQTIDGFLKKEINIKCSKAIHLLFSANRWEMNDLVKTSLSQGVWVIADRYTLSGLVYTCAHSKEDIHEWCKFSDNGLVIPDIAFLLKSTHHRRQQGDEYFETPEFQENVLKLFNKYQKDYISIETDKAFEITALSIQHIINFYIANNTL